VPYGVNPDREWWDGRSIDAVPDSEICDMVEGDEAQRFSGEMPLFVAALWTELKK